jgi:SanA protein
MVHAAGTGRLYESPDSVPYRQVGLLLGTSPRDLTGSPNPYFTERIHAAATLYEHKKIDYLLVSGDNEHRSYNEPEQMRAALISAGVPKSAIVLDYAGFRTLDSVVRASAVFRQTSVTIISQEFHNRRALYIADRYGLDAIAFSAPLGRDHMHLRLTFREALARCLAVIDSAVLRTQPRYYGEPVPIPGPSER